MSFCSEFTWLLRLLMGPKKSGTCQAAGGPEQQWVSEASLSIRAFQSRSRFGPDKNGRGQAEGTTGFIKTQTA